MNKQKTKKYIANIKNRMRDNYRLAIVTLFGIIACFSIAPFIGIRIWREEYVGASINTFIFISLISCMVVAWINNSRWIGIASWIAVLLNTTGATASAIFQDSSVSYWVLAVVLSNYFLVEKRKAVGLNAIAVVLVGMDFKDTMSFTQEVSFFMCAIILSAFAAIIENWNRMQMDQLNALASVDHLTGVGNRRAFDRHAEACLSAFNKKKNEQENYAMIMFDIDDFKSINDRFGHLLGDLVLKKMAKEIEKELRTLDKIFRTGGEEFVLITIGMSKENLKSFCERMKAISNQFNVEGVGKVTFSFGASQLKREDTLEDWMRKSDQAMYKAKQLGKNTYTIFEKEPQGEQRD